MYKKSKTIINNKENISNYIEGIDVYNSYFLSKIKDPNIDRTPYEITVYEYRPDLITRDFYGSENYLGILLVQNPINLSSYTKGTVIKLIPKNIIDQLINII